MAALPTRAVGRDGVELTRVGLGGVELGPEEGEMPDVDRAVRVLAAAADAGINWIDTAEDYYENRNEALIGEALARCEAAFHVSTKVGPSRASSGFRPEQVRAACQGSLRRLRRDQLDVYLLHWPDDVVPLEETWGTMSELVEEGLVRAIGLSNFDIGDIERCHAQRTVDLVQDGSPSSTISTPGRASGVARSSASLLSWEISVAQLALAWVLHQPGVSWVLAGSRDGGHVHDNAAAAAVDVRASLDELEALIPLGPSFA